MHFRIIVFLSCLFFSLPAAGQGIKTILIEGQPAIDGNDVVVSLDTGVGATYQLRRRETLASGDWQNEGTAADGTGANVELRHEGALPMDKQSYDVLIVSPDS